MHVNDVAAQFGKEDRVEWVACADTVPVTPELRNDPYTRRWNLNHALTSIGVPSVYADYREMLQKEEFDLIIVTSENARHAEVVEACATAGADVCIEKPMAPSLQEALRMARACDRSDSFLMVNWPMTWQPEGRAMKRLIDQGAIGRPLEIRMRLGHNGPLGPGNRHKGVSDEAAPMSGHERASTWWHQSAMGGGAFLDYCCYGAMVCRWFLGGAALAALGMKANLDSHWGDADDNGVMIVRYPDAIALLEGSWTTLDHGVPTGPIVIGTEGTLVMENIGGVPRVRLERGHGNTEIHKVDPLPEGREDIAREYLHYKETGEPVHETLQTVFNLEAMAILDAGVRSSTSGSVEVVDRQDWRFGTCIPS
jgi:predicted dehydrogenase